MIKAVNKNSIILGLSDENMKRLKEGQPILFNLKELGLQDMNVVIFNGRNEDEMKQELKEKIHPYLTSIIDHRVGNKN